jgi:hypothetical protein
MIGMNVMALLQQAQELPAGGDAGGSMVGQIVALVVGVLVLVSTWKVFSKAGEPGWASFVPIYNTVVLLKIAGKPIWWLALFLVPVANVIAMVLAAVGIAQRFGKGAGFGLGLLLVPFVFIPLLAFGDAEYQGGAALRPAAA